jgi:hypothetical protein
LLDDPDANVPLLKSGAADVIGQADYESRVLRPSIAPDIKNRDPWFLPDVLVSPGNGGMQLVQPQIARSQLDITPPPALADRLGHYALPNCASFKVEWSLDPRSAFVGGRLDDVREVLWFDPGDNGDPTIANDPPDPLRALADKIASVDVARNLAPPIEQAALARKGTALLELLGVISPGTPYFVDFPRRYSDGSYDLGFPNNPKAIRYSLTDRFRDPNHPDSDGDYGWSPLSPDGRANLVAFTATRSGPVGSAPVPDAIFPAALRITVDVFDEHGRLDRPVRHVMVIPVGE